MKDTDDLGIFTPPGLPVAPTAWLCGTSPGGHPSLVIEKPDGRAIRIENRPNVFALVVQNSDGLPLATATIAEEIVNFAIHGPDGSVLGCIQNREVGGRKIRQLLVRNARGEQLVVSVGDGDFVIERRTAAGQLLQRTEGD